MEIKCLLLFCETSVAEYPPDLGDSDSGLTRLYEAHNQIKNLDYEPIRADFKVLYCAMNGMELREMDRIIYTICTLCRNHEKAGFVAGVKVGVLLQSELSEK